MNPKTRRELLAEGASLAGAAGLSLAFEMPAAAWATQDDSAATRQILPTPPSIRRGDMLYRKLGRTGEEVSLIGMGGFHIGKQNEESESIRLIHAAIDRGINFMDNCWDYHDGLSELRMGKALRDGYRKKVFLMTKIDGRTKKEAAKQIDESLARLQTDHLDLCQFHEILRLEDPDRVFAKDGAMEAMLAAKEAGKVRFIGFTGHKDPMVHRRMLEVSAKNNFRFDTVQMPLNLMDTHFRSFQHTVLPLLVRDNIGVLGMKTFGDHFILDYILQNKLATPIQCLHYGMNLPTSVVITGIDRMEILDQAFEAARTFQPMSAAQVAALEAKTQTAALTGEYEKFKTTPHFDGTAQNPKWLGGESVPKPT